MRLHSNGIFLTLLIPAVMSLALLTGCPQITGLVTEKPIADAGTAITDAVVGDSVLLDGTGSRNGTSFAWTFLSKPPSSTLTDSEIFNKDKLAAIFTPDVPGTYRFNLAVSNAGGSAAAALVVTVKLPAATYRVSYDANGGTGTPTGAVPVDPERYLKSDTVTVLSNSGGLALEGYTFAGWSRERDGSSPLTGGSTFAMGGADVVLYASWLSAAIATYKVSYSAPDAKDPSKVPVDANNYQAGATVRVLAAPQDLTKDLNTFAGWSDGITTYQGATGSFTMGGSDVSLRALWTTNPTYRVGYSAPTADDPSQVPSDPNTYQEGATVTLLAKPNKLVKKDYDFAGWSKSSDGSAPYVASLAMGAADVIFYAGWTKTPTYMVSYDANGGTLAPGKTLPAAIDYKQGDTVTLEGNPGLSLAGSSFAGWSTSKNGAAIASLAMGSADIVLYAAWTTNPTYTVTYALSAGEAGASFVDTSTYQSGATVAVLGNPGNLTKANNTLSGWSDGTTTYVPSTGSFTMGGANVTLRAVWTAILPPEPPTGVKATVTGSGQVKVEWNSVTTALSYNVYYRVNSSTAATSDPHQETSGGSLTLTGLTVGSQYGIVVAAVNSAGMEGPASAAVTANLQKVNGFKAIALNGSYVWLTWDPVAGATSYDIYYKAGTSASASDTKAGTQTGTTAYINPLATGTQYAFIVVASPSGAISDVATATPPSSLPSFSSIVPSDGGATVNWNVYPGATSYMLYYKAGSGAMANNAAAGPFTGTSGAISGLTNGTVYSLVLVATGSSGSVQSQVTGFSPSPATSNLLVNPTWNSNTNGWSFVGGGSGWASSSSGINGGLGYVSSFAWGTHSQTVDLTASYTAAQLATPTTTITFSEFVTGTYGPGKYGLMLELLDSSGAVLDSASYGTQASPMLTPDTGAWSSAYVKQSVSYTNSSGKAIAKARVTAGGQDTVGWGGQYGTSFSGPSLTVSNVPHKAVYSSQGLYTLSVPAAATVTVKAWGAGGGGSAYIGGSSGGAGAYSYASFSAAAGQTLYIAVGAGGGRTVTAGNPALGGRNAGTGGAGGGGSVVALYNGSGYVLEACAGGGGGGPGSGVQAGAGGQAGSTYNGYPGINGVGGNAGQGGVGANMSLSASTFGGLGGAGGNAANAGSGGGGGGYGGGASSGYASYYYEGAGGGCYNVPGNGGFVQAGVWTTVASAADPDYAAGAGSAGSPSALQGGDGRVVVTIIY